MPLCTGPSTRQVGPCRDPEALCVADSEFSFNFSLDSSNDVRFFIPPLLSLRLTRFPQDLTTIPISALIPSASLVTESTAFSGSFPTPPSIGDFNIDGYPDLLIITSHAGARSVNLLESRPCDKVSCTPGEMQKGRRAFRVVFDGAEALTRIKDAESAHWVDMDDDVRAILSCFAQNEADDVVAGIARYHGAEERQLGSSEAGRLYQEQLLPRRVLPQGSWYVVPSEARKRKLNDIPSSERSLSRMVRAEGAWRESLSREFCRSSSTFLLLKQPPAALRC